MTQSSEITKFVEQIHRLETRFVLATNGGSGAIAALTSVPGASRTVLEARVPYSPAALADWLGSEPEQFVSDRTARAMAMTAYFRAKKLAPGDERVAGVACTASLASDRPKRGPHRAHLAWQTAETTSSFSIELVKGARDRRQEEEVVSELLLNMVAEAGGSELRLRPDLSSDERPETQRVDAPIEWQALVAGRGPAVCVGGASTEPPAALLCGAFNPVHVGHERMADLAESILGAPVAIELSIANVDKPPLDYIEIAQRAAQFHGKRALWLTHAPTFVEKAGCFPKTVFVVGADTIVRIADPRYYQNDSAKVVEGVRRISELGCRFLVFGRIRGEEFVQLSDLALPPDLAAICQEVPAAVFREDVSSTALRKNLAR